MEIAIERNVMVSMRDGVRLATDIYRPASDVPVPALVHRLPYGKHLLANVSTFLLNPIEAVERGYAVAVQDTRGCWASEGDFHPIFQERNDGHDTIEWISRAPWCNGQVGIYGSSYMGVTTLQASVDAPPSLKASLAYLTASNYHDSYCYVGGAFELGFQLRWSLTNAAAQARRSSIGAAATAQIDAVMAAFRANPSAFFETSLDVRSLPCECKSLIPYYVDNLNHPNYDDYWAEIDVIAAAKRILIPVLTIAGWHDAFLKGGTDLFQTLVERGPESTRRDHALLIGPWDHRAYLSSQTLSMAGKRDFGPSASGGQPGLQDTALSWFDRWLRGKEQEFPCVKYFHMGPNRWEEASSWPPSPFDTTRWYLHSGGNAKTRFGDGTLDSAKPELQSPDSFLYDPNHPVPTVSGRHLMYHLPSGVQDQRETEDREDVLVYSSSPLTDPIAMIGRVQLDLYFTSSAPTTDFVVVLSDVNPDDTVDNVAEGIARVTTNNSPEEESIQLVTIDLWDTAYTFEIGHRIRIHLTSSCFPRFDRNRNVSLTNPNSEAFDVAMQCVHHDGQYPSALVFRTRVDEA